MTRRSLVVAVALGSLFAAPDLASAQGSAQPRRAAPRETVRTPAPVSDRGFELDLTTGVRHYTWTESEGGRDLLTESGAQFVIGATPRVRLGQERRFLIEGDVQVYFGAVGYDGALQDIANNRLIPYKSSTSYFGFEVNPRAGYVFSIGERLQITPLAGLSLEHWSRDIDPINGANVGHGYLETYNAFFMQGAVRAGYSVSRGVRLNAMLSLKMPLSISENIDDTRHGKPEHSLSPGFSPRLGLEVGASIHRFNVALSLDRWTLARSPDTLVVENGQRLTYHQPDSTRTIFGFRVGYEL